MRDEWDIAADNHAKIRVATITVLLCLAQVLQGRQVAPLKLLGVHAGVPGRCRLQLYRAKDQQFPDVIAERG